MDSGLGSDEDRRSRTKEQKQLHNQQLLSGCFIDASSLSDECEVNSDHRRNDERRQGALIFQSSIPQFSMLQMTHSEQPLEDYDEETPSETSTPYNSIVQNETRKSPLHFYVDLSEVPDVPEENPAGPSKKNIFSMVIDFEGPKKTKPSKLSSSTLLKARNKKSSLGKCSNGAGGSLSSSVSSINSTRDVVVAGTSRQSEELERKAGHQQPLQSSKENSLNLEVLSASLVKNLTIAADSSSPKSSNNNSNSSSCENVLEDKSKAEVIVENKHVSPKPAELVPKVQVQVETEKKSEVQAPISAQFVKLSDLECQKPRCELNFTPRMSRSIPESSWVESPLLMSRSAGYRSAPHPLEPENGELSDSDSVTSNTTNSQPRRSVQRLGTDLLRMFLEEIGPDVTVEVEGHKMKAHKCILASRCQYFAALLSGNWLEKSGNVISLQGFSYESVYFSLCHIYSGAAHVPDSISLVELASLADMLGLEGLKEVVEHALKQRHCHNFHRPCAGCCTGILEVLPLSAAYGLDELYQKCLQWITLHFVRVWPSRAFASLPRELREKCYQQHVVHMTPDRVLETVLACDKILATLPALRWAEPVSQLVVQLADACHLYHRQHFAAVLAAPSFLALDSGLGWNVCQVEEQIVQAAKNLGVEQACKSYTRCCRMLEQNWTRPFSDLLNKIKLQLEQCLVGQADRLIRSNAWLRLDTALRSRIKELTPSLEPTSRLPRATPIRKKLTAGSKTQGSPVLSSSDSSRNSSPGINQQRHNSNGSPSLRRSLLLAARAPQVPPSPSAHRRSTLTQPTAASAAKSATTRNKPTPPVVKPASAVKVKAPVAKKVVTVVRNQPKKDMVAKRPESRCSSPLKDSRTSSPRKFDSRLTSPVGKIDSRPSSPRKPRKSEVVASTPPSTMQRSGTFLKDEPTVLHKIL